VNFEFHYYVVRWLAGKAGVDGPSADIMANSSQMVDASVDEIEVALGGGVLELVPKTQDYAFWDQGTQADIYLPFHFFPGGGGGAARKDGLGNPWSVAPGAEPVKELLIGALKTRDPYRIGIALHTYADSWAHQNFSPWLEDWNRLSSDDPIPPVGHAQALKSPDMLDEEWDDARLVSPHVANRPRWREAAEKMYKYLATFSGKGFGDFELVMDRLESIWGRPGSKKREERIFDLIIDEPMPDYLRGEWHKKAGLAAFVPGADKDSGYSRLGLLARKLLPKGSIRAAPSSEEAYLASDLRKWASAALAHRDEARRIASRLGPIPR
jgi:hypothetical protein